VTENTQLSRGICGFYGSAERVWLGQMNKGFPLAATPNGIWEVLDNFSDYVVTVMSVRSVSEF